MPKQKKTQLTKEQKRGLRRRDIRRLESGKKTIFERENQSVFVRILGALLGVGKQY